MSANGNFHGDAVSCTIKMEPKGHVHFTRDALPALTASHNARCKPSVSKSEDDTDFSMCAMSAGPHTSRIHVMDGKIDSVRIVFNKISNHGGFMIPTIYVEIIQISRAFLLLVFV